MTQTPTLEPSLKCREGPIKKTWNLNFVAIFDTDNKNHIIIINYVGSAWISDTGLHKWGGAH